ncbi:stage V sporulation protein SpoVM [Sporosarcina sp. HYO08]|uniref:stage V sporulation protein SpoVM n=1 Tax=Sporosarcina sp. HYO08 TaxID=1759557 RepID=UPI0009E68889|nr:stage V sporulation protein SpoVM [Sporosarcina sp. HYO08]
MLNGKKYRFLKGAGELRVYTFTMPKFVSGFVRKCLFAFQKDNNSKTATASNRNKKRKKEKTPS